jgi:hypothetical protein
VSVAEARKLAESDGASWDDVSELVALQAVPRPAEPRRPSALLREQRSKKRQRLRLLFGYGDSAEIIAKLNKIFGQSGDRNFDLRTVLSCLTTPDPPRVDRAFFVQAWYRAGECRAAIEELLESLADRRSSPVGESQEHAHGFLYGGLALQAVGDPISAWACFRLATHFDMREPNAPPRGRDEKSNVFDMAADYLKRLEGAEQQLDSPSVSLEYRARGLEIPEWFSRNRLAGRWLNYAKDRIDSFDSARHRRTVRAVAEQNGWLPELLPIDDSSIPRPPSFRLGVPAVLPLREHPADRRIPYPLHPPEPLPRFSDGPRSPSARLNLGFTKGPRATAASVELEPGSAILLTSHVAKDDLCLSLATQLQRQGWTVLWVRRTSGGPGTGALPTWLDIRCGVEMNDVVKTFLAVLTLGNSTRLALRQRLRASFPSAEDPAASACIDELLRCLSDAMPCLESATELPARREAARIAGRVANLSFDTARDIRRLALLVSLLTRILVALRKSLRTALTVPPDDSGSKIDGVMLDVSEGDELSASVLSILAAASLVGTASQVSGAASQSGPVYDHVPDDFDLAIRKRAEAPSSSVRRPHPPRADSGLLEDNYWVDANVLASGTPARVCVLAQGVSPQDWRCLRAVLRSGELGNDHAIIGAVDWISGKASDPAGLADCSTYVIRDLSPAQRTTFEIASGIKLTPNPDVLRDHESTLLTVQSNAVRQSQILVWPTHVRFSDGKGIVG